MDSSGGRFNFPASISQHPAFQFSNSISEFVLNDIKNEELNWGSFIFKNEIESQNQELDSSSFLFNSNIVSSSRTANYPVYDFKDQRGNVSDLNFQLQTWPTTISGNKMEESMKSQVLDWNDKSQPKEIDLSIEVRKVEPESLQFTQKDGTFTTIQASKQQDRFEDGYNWRKYGQKQVKGSKKPRSYFKCSYPNCPTKKKVEKDLNGYITEIIYKGKHNHPMPQNMKKSPLNSFQNTIFDHSVDKSRLESSSQNSLASFGEDKYDQASSNDYEDEPKAKKWKLDEAEDEAISYIGSKTLQEPRVVIETRSEVDILDDGYKWRKYGQKVIKGNPNPRSYYKCINVGCTVRKLVERASHDLQVVVTTYEAKHNHGVPAPRGSGGGSSYATNQPPTSNTTKNSNNHMPVTSRPLPNYLYNVHETTHKVQTPHSLQTLENSKDYGFFERSYSNHDWEMLLLSSTTEGPKNEYFSNPFV